MSSVVIAGDTSGTCTLQAPAVAGSTVLTLPATTGTVLTQNSSAPANSLVVDASGNVGIGVTSPACILDISGATGGQVKFPATQNASTNANTLDDYEEGTWTPIATPSSGSFGSYSASGTYTKIGNIVSLNFNIIITAVGTVPPNASITVTGAPFAGSTNTGAGVCREIAVSGFTGSIYFSVGTNLILTNYSSSGAVPANNTYLTCGITYRPA